MKKVLVLGSTGSIGKQALEVIAAFPERFCVAGISCRRNASLLAQQIKAFRPPFAALTEGSLQPDTHTQVFCGEDALIRLIEESAPDIVINALVGIAGLVPTLTALNAGVPVALANKESLVAGGHLVTRTAKEKNAALIPVDSEHSAIWQCLNFGERKDAERLVLTASGGPFRTYSAAQLQSVTKEDALRHPTWNMGAKITVDCATMMNKGFEIIEAMHLFDMPLSRIDAVVHPESIIHSMVAFKDGAVLAHMSSPSMKLPIQTALTYPERMQSGLTTLDFAKLGALHFEKPDEKRFPCLKLARQAGEQGGLAPTRLNAANEVLVEYFLNGLIKFNEIPYHIDRVMQTSFENGKPTLPEILECDQKTRQELEITLRSQL